MKLLSIVIICIIVSSCTSTSPREGGLFGGIKGIPAGAYKKKLEERNGHLDSVIKRLKEKEEKLNKEIARYEGERRQIELDNNSKNKKTASGFRYPEFPWPPPKASNIDILPAKFFTNAVTLDGVDKKISEALLNSGYTDKSYFSIPNGFAITTRIERISKNGVSKLSPRRWTTKVESLGVESFSLALYLKALFTANIGYYRVIVFTISSEPFTQSKKFAGKRFITSLIQTGANELKNDIKNKIYSESKYTVTAHIYAFEKPEFGEAHLILPSYLSGRDHLRNARIILYLEQ